MGSSIITILISAAVIGIIGLLAGVGLAIASVKLAVPRDEKAEAIQELLPGANCGACGFSGCSGYAAALAKGEAEPNLCAPGGIDCATAIAELLGTSVGDFSAKAAVVACNGCNQNTQDKLEYSGLKSCSAAVQLFGGKGSCSFGCIGFGDCMNVCSNNAITICDGVAKIDLRLCGACGQCIPACPKHLISIVPIKEQAVVRCSNHDKGAETRKVCSVGCIGCMKCQKVCEAGAISVVNFLAHVDPDKCTNCGKCIEACPAKCISELCEINP